MSSLVSDIGCNRHCTLWYGTVPVVSTKVVLSACGHFKSWEVGVKASVLIIS